MAAELKSLQEFDLEAVLKTDKLDEFLQTDGIRLIEENLGFVWKRMEGPVKQYYYFEAPNYIGVLDRISFWMVLNYLKQGTETALARCAAVLRKRAWFLVGDITIRKRS